MQVHLEEGSEGWSHQVIGAQMSPRTGWQRALTGGHHVVRQVEDVAFVAADGVHC